MRASFIHIQSGAIGAAIHAEAIRPYTLNIETPPVLGGAEVAVDSRVHWYAAYTCANHEKRVAEQLDVRSVEHFLATYSSVRRWKDRRVMVQLPLFPGYVFVRLALRDRLRVLQIPSVVRMVGFNGHPAALPDREIDTLRSGVAAQLRAEPHPYLTVGRRVRVKRGPLEGAEGILVRRKGKLRVVLSLALIARSAAVEVDAADIERVA